MRGTAGRADDLGTAPALANSKCQTPAFGLPVAGVAPTPVHRGYWTFNDKGGVAYGDATPNGERQGQQSARPIVGLASSLDGKGYLLAAAAGGLFTFGDAGDLGSPANSGPIPAPIVGIALSPLAQS